MRPLSHRVLSAALILLISAAILLALAGAVLSLVLARKMESRLQAVNATIGSLRINLFTRGIRIKDFEWTPPYDSVSDPDSIPSQPHKIFIKDIHASGLQIFSLLRNKSVSLRKLTIADGTVFINSNFKSSAGKPGNDSIPISGIDIDRLTLSNIDFTLAKDTLKEYQGALGLILHQVSLERVQDFRDPSAYRVRNVEATAKDISIRKSESLYNFTIQKIAFDKELKRLRIDSIALQPLLDKTAWGKQVKSQQTRTDVTIQSVAAEGVNMAVHLQDTSIMISAVTISQPRIWAFKDKRYPFTRKEKFPLPMELFRSMHIGVEVDSIIINDGAVTYEEFPEEGFKTGRITFDEMQATMSSVNNREFKNMSGYSTLKAKAKVMKTGAIEATFRLPLEASKKYEAEGTILNVPLPELNIMLRPIAFVEISSGTLNRLGFAFSYDDVASAGKVTFDYEDLKIVTLKKERSRNVNAFKSLVVNTAVKNDQTITGDISIERDQKKAVFNFWAISLLDGIKAGMLPPMAQKEKKK